MMTALNVQVQVSGPNRGQVSAVKRQIQNQLSNINADVQIGSKSLQNVNKELEKGRRSAQSFGDAIGLSARRFVAYTSAVAVVGRLSSALTRATRDAIKFEREFVKLAQVFETSTRNLDGLSKEISSLSREFGISANVITRTSVVLAQSGLSARDTEKALRSLAKTTLASTFENIGKTAEGAVAILAQFQQGVGSLEAQLGSINAVSKKFAVESGDIIEAIRRAGGAFNAAGGNLEEFIALFTAVRSTTRESAETIATGFRTIFARIQRPRVLDYFRELGIILEENGQFVGSFEAIKRLSDGLNRLNIRPGQTQFAEIVEQLGGIRQVSRVIPLLTRFEKAQRALNVAQQGSTSLNEDVAKAQETLAQAFARTQENFSALIREISQTETFQAFVKIALNLANAFIEVARSLKPLIPLIGALGAIKLGGIARQAFSKGTSSSVLQFNRGGQVPGSGSGDTVPAMLEPGEFVIRKSAVQAFGAENLAGINKYADGGIAVTAAGRRQSSIQDRIFRDKKNQLKNLKSGRAFNDGDEFVQNYTKEKIDYPKQLKSKSKRVLNALQKQYSLPPLKSGDFANNFEKFALKKKNAGDDGGKFGGNNPLDGISGNNRLFEVKTGKVSPSEIVGKIVAHELINNGRVKGKTTSRVDKNIQTLSAKVLVPGNELPSQIPAKKKAKGGSISGTGTDTVPALLTPGEFVINKKSAEAFGYDNLKKVNKYAKGGVVQRFQTGGEAKRVSSLFTEEALTTSEANKELERLRALSDSLGEAFSDLTRVATDFTEGLTAKEKDLLQKAEGRFGAAKGKDTLVLKTEQESTVLDKIVQPLGRSIQGVVDKAKSLVTGQSVEQIQVERGRSGGLAGTTILQHELGHTVDTGLSSREGTFNNILSQTVQSSRRAEVASSGLTGGGAEYRTDNPGELYADTFALANDQAKVFLADMSKEATNVAAAFGEAAKGIEQGTLDFGSANADIVKKANELAAAEQAAKEATDKSAKQKAARGAESELRPLRQQGEAEIQSVNKKIAEQYRILETAAKQEATVKKRSAKVGGDAVKELSKLSDTQNDAIDAIEALEKEREELAAVLKEEKNQARQALSAQRKPGVDPGTVQQQKQTQKRQREREETERQQRRRSGPSGPSGPSGSAADKVKKTAQDVSKAGDSMAIKFLAISTIFAQTGALESFGKLANRATSSLSGFLSGIVGGEDAAKKLVEGLSGAVTQLFIFTTALQTAGIDVLGTIKGSFGGSKAGRLLKGGFGAGSKAATRALESGSGLFGAIGAGGAKGGALAARAGGGKVAQVLGKASGAIGGVASAASAAAGPLLLLAAGTTLAVKGFQILFDSVVGISDLQKGVDLSIQLGDIEGAADAAGELADAQQVAAGLTIAGGVAAGAALGATIGGIAGSIGGPLAFLTAGIGAAAGGIIGGLIGIVNNLDDFLFNTRAINVAAARTGAALQQTAIQARKNEARNKELFRTGGAEQINEAIAGIALEIKSAEQSVIEAKKFVEEAKKGGDEEKIQDATDKLTQAQESQVKAVNRNRAEVLGLVQATAKQTRGTKTLDDVLAKLPKSQRDFVQGLIESDKRINQGAASLELELQGAAAAGKELRIGFESFVQTLDALDAVVTGRFARESEIRQFTGQETTKAQQEQVLSERASLATQGLQTITKGLDLGDTQFDISTASGLASLTKTIQETQNELDNLNNGAKDTSDIFVDLTGSGQKEKITRDNATEFLKQAQESQKRGIALAKEQANVIKQEIQSRLNAINATNGYIESFAFASNEQRRSMDKTFAAAQRLAKSSGDVGAIRESQRGDVQSLLNQFKGTGLKLFDGKTSEEVLGDVRIQQFGGEEALRARFGEDTEAADAAVKAIREGSLSEQDKLIQDLKQINEAINNAELANVTIFGTAVELFRDSVLLQTKLPLEQTKPENIKLTFDDEQRKVRDEEAKQAGLRAAKGKLTNVDVQRSREEFTQKSANTKLPNVPLNEIDIYTEESKRRLKDSPFGKAARKVTQLAQRQAQPGVPTLEGAGALQASLDNFNTSSAKLAEVLQNHSIPETITMDIGSPTVNVNLNGAEILSSLHDSVDNLINDKIIRAFQARKNKDQSGDSTPITADDLGGQNAG